MEEKTKRAVLTGLIILVLAGSFWWLKNTDFFNRREAKELQKTILSYGVLAPVTVVAMILLTTIIPPIPLPVPLVEIVAGVIFGFWGGWLVAWIGQIVSSMAAFGTSRLFKKTMVGRWLGKWRWGYFRTFLEKKGAKAVVISRATMSTPFNIISFLAGITTLNWLSFLGATMVGVIPETVIYALIGSELRKLHIHYLWLSTIILAISLAGFGIPLIIATAFKPKNENK